MFTRDLLLSAFFFFSFNSETMNRFIIGREKYIYVIEIRKNICLQKHRFCYKHE